MGKIKFMVNHLKDLINEKKKVIPGLNGDKVEETISPDGITVQSYWVETVIQKLMVPRDSGFDYVRVDKIIYCEAAGSYTVFHLNDAKELTASRSLSDFEKVLFPYNFFRVHKSHLINLARVSGYSKHDGEFVIMDNGQPIAVSRRKKDDFLRLLIDRS